MSNSLVKTVVLLTAAGAIHLIGGVNAEAEGKPLITPIVPEHSLSAGKFVYFQWKATGFSLPTETELRASLCKQPAQADGKPECTELETIGKLIEPLTSGGRFFFLNPDTAAGDYTVKLTGPAFPDASFNVKVDAAPSEDGEDTDFILHVPKGPWFLGDRATFSWSYLKTDTEGRFNSIHICVTRQANDTSCLDPLAEQTVPYSNGTISFDLKEDANFTAADDFYLVYERFLDFNQNTPPLIEFGPFSSNILGPFSIKPASAKAADTSGAFFVVPQAAAFGLATVFFVWMVFV